MGPSSIAWRTHRPLVLESSEDRAFFHVYRLVALAFPVMLALCTFWALSRLALVRGDSVALLRLLWGSAQVAAMTLLVAVPLGAGAGLYVAVFSEGASRRLAAHTLDFLAVVPSVVWGVFAREVLASQFALAPLVASALVLGFVVAPTFACLVRDGLAAIAPEVERAALSLGGTRWAALRLALFPLARRGIVGSIGAAFGRALGEAIAVALVLPSAQTLGASISMGTAPKAASGLLFVVCMTVQVLARGWSRRPPPKARIAPVGRYEKRSRALALGAMALCVVAFGMVATWLGLRSHGPLTALLPALAMSLLVGTFALLLALPLGLAGAIFVSEFPNDRATSVVRTSAELLASTPPIVVGACALWGWERDLLPAPLLATLGLALLLAPSMLRRAVRVIAKVAPELRESALALGASRFQVLGQIVLGTCRRRLFGVSAGALARTLGSTAPLVLLPGFVTLPVATFRSSLAGETLVNASSSTQPSAALLAAALLCAIGLLKIIALALQPAEGI
jgi:ABC-type phosphate transport system permease subunit